MIQVTPDMTVADALAELDRQIEYHEAQAAERKQMREMFRLVLKAADMGASTLGAVSPSKNGSSAAPDKKVKRRGVRGEIPQPGTRARHAYDILLEADRPLTQPEIRSQFMLRGIDDQYDQRFLTKIYTALSRHPKIFTRIEDGRWVLTSRKAEFPETAKLPLN